MPNKAVLNYRIVLAIALLLLAIRLPLGAFFVSASDLTDENISMAINQERTQRNVPALNYNSKLAAAADYKSNDMINRHYFSHTDPEGNYIWDKIAAEGYTPYVVLGENLAIDFSDTSGLVAAWMDSPTHRENILNPAFKDQGMGVAFGDVSAGQYSVAVTNTFGAQPIVSAPAPAPVTAPTAQTAPKQTTPKQVAETPKTSTSPAPAPAPAPTPTPVQQTPSSSATPSQPIRTEASPQINHSSVVIVPSLLNGELNFDIQAAISGLVQSVHATLAGKTVALQSDGQIYTGALTYDKYFNYQNSTITLEADDSKGNSDIYSVPLAGYNLPAGQNPKSAQSLAATVAHPDMYNVFKYIVIVFGILFLIFMLGDAVHFKRIRALTNINIGSNIVILFLLISTLLLVNWWH